MSKRGFSLLFALLLGAALSVFAGAPFVTDDPIPTDYHSWEVYLASQHAETADGWSGVAGEIEIDYGAISNLQLHAIAPLSYVAPRDDSVHPGYGDSELGAKYRFVNQTDKLPDAAIYPALEIPTGRESSGLGSGHVQAFLPLWLQKDFGDWTIYGGGGYGINPGSGNQNWEIVGAVVQRQITKNLSLGGEIYHRTAMDVGGRGDTAFDIGTTIDFGEHNHFLFSAGRSLDGPTDFQVYIGWQFTFSSEYFRSLLNSKMP